MDGASISGGTLLRTGALVAGLLVAVGGCGSNGNSGNTVSVGTSTSTSTSTARSGSVSSSVSCRDDVCTIRVSGDPSGTRLGVLGRGFRIESIDADAVTVRVDGGGSTEATRIPSGSTVTVGGLSVTVVTVTSVGGGDQEAELTVRRT